MAKKKMIFEDAIKEMEDIINTIENGDIPLSKSIELYKKGINLSMECGEFLQGVEEEVTILYKNIVDTKENIVENAFSVDE